MDKDTGRWVPTARADADATECPIRGLQDGHEYMFRVKAVNDEGESEPLETDAAIKAKDPYGNDCLRAVWENVNQLILCFLCMRHRLVSRWQPSSCIKIKKMYSFCHARSVHLKLYDVVF
jgi:hypothetical protein